MKKTLNHFNPKETKWGEIQYYAQDIIAICVEEDAKIGFSSEEFINRLEAYTKIIEVLLDRENDFIIKN